MHLYKINDDLFLHNDEFNQSQLQDLVSGMMMEYRQEIVPQYKQIADLKNSGDNQSQIEAKKLENKLPNPYEFFQRYGFTHLEVNAQAITHLEVLEKG